MATPTKTFALLCKTLRQFERSGDIKKLNTFLDSAEYAAAFAALDTGQKAKVRVLTGKAYAKAEQKLKPIPRYSKKGWRIWDEVRIAKLRSIERAAVKAGDRPDEAIARAFGISLKAAMAARRRYVGARPVHRFGAGATSVSRAA
jgi:hypothetical protein